MTTNWAVTSPTARRIANVVLSVAGLGLGCVFVYDFASTHVDWSEELAPWAAVYAFLASTYGVTVTLPRVKPAPGDEGKS